MRNMPAKILKIDWHHKLPSKIKFHTGRGKCFAPFRSAITVQNEDGLTTFWKCFPCSESIEMVKPDLENMKRRFQIIDPQPNCSGKVSYVNNCCSVHEKLVEIFPGMLVKRNNYHWNTRWDEILLDKNSEEASLFRHLMRRAVFLVENTEFNRVKYQNQ